MLQIAASSLPRTVLESSMSDDHALVPVGYVERRILFIRGERVILDTELAVL